MTISISMNNPTSGQRQVPLDTGFEFEISGVAADGYGPDVSTLSVQINGIYAIFDGTFQRPAVYFSNDQGAAGTPPPETTRFYTIPNNPFLIGDVVTVMTSGLLLTPHSIQTYITSISPDGKTIELQDAIELLPANEQPSSYRIDIIAQSRGFVGTIAADGYGNVNIAIDAFQSLPPNAIIFNIVQVETLNPVTTNLARGVFIFRTVDTFAPQLVGFPSVINNSNLAFKVVDILGNFVPPNLLTVFFNNQLAISDGYLESGFMGEVQSLSDSDVQIYLRPSVKLIDGEQVNVQIQVSDGYGNQATYSETVVNRSIIPTVEFISVTPVEETVIDPTSAAITIRLRSTNPVPNTFVNLFAEVPGVVDPTSGSQLLPIIKAGTFMTCPTCPNNPTYTGYVESGTDIYIHVDEIFVAAFNSKLNMIVQLQEVTDLLDIPPGSVPFFTKQFEYKTISANLPPAIKDFFPSSVDIVSPTTQILFTIQAQIAGAPVNINATTVVVNNVIVIDHGAFTNGYTGSVSSRQGSNGHAADVTINQPQGASFSIGSTVNVNVTAADIAGNVATFNTTFVVVNTNPPVITITPPGGVYGTLTRVQILSDQPSIIYFTTNGSLPTPGQIGTFSDQSPVSNVPIFDNGITQVKAYGVNASGVRGAVTTEIYDLNTSAPLITITSPSQNTLLTVPNVTVEYTLTVTRGYITKVEYSLNNGPLIDTENTLPQSSILVTGMQGGTNTIKITAFDNYGNVGRAQVSVNVDTAQIIDFSVSYTPLSCPQFTQRIFKSTSLFNDLVDTDTVVIIGLGARAETLVSYGLGNGLDGLPVNFAASGASDGRHFALVAFPVVPNTLQVSLFRKKRTIVLDPLTYTFNAASGQIVLDHPIETGEALTVTYVAEPDINTPTLYLPTQTKALFTKHGQPSSENTVSLGAQVAFENGATRVLAVQAESLLVDPQWLQTFKVLENEEGYWIVPVLRNRDVAMYYPSILAAGFDHVNNMSFIKNRKERILGGYRLPNTTNPFGQSRAYLASIDLNPPITRVIDGAINELNGTLVAAAIAGRGSGLGPIALPLTNKALTGFNLGTTLKSPALNLDQVIAQGFLPVLTASAGGLIYRGRSTYIGSVSPVQEELSVQRTVDFISKTTRRLVEARFIGQLITGDTIKRITSAIDNYLATQSAIISSGKTTSVVVDSQEPRQLNVNVILSPLFPLNEVQLGINFVVNL